MSRWLHDWIEIPTEEAREGDLYANGATITEVVFGPADSAGYWWKDIPEDEVVVIFGESGSRKGKREDRIVVGRNARRSNV